MAVAGFDDAIGDQSEYADSYIDRSFHHAARDAART